jgi:hypothetical protein
MALARKTSRIVREEGRRKREEGREGGFGVKDVLIVVPGSRLTVLYSKFEVA